MEPTLSLAIRAVPGGGRVRQALVCPYCRDQVSRRGTVVCAARSCGALYHRDCWEECARLYGGCAIYGCSSKRSREVSVAGYFLRISRLAIAAMLFPPRAVRALSLARARGEVTWPSAWRVIREVIPSPRVDRNSWFTIATCGGAMVASSPFILMEAFELTAGRDLGAATIPALLGVYLVGVAILGLAIGVAVAVPIALGVHLGQIAARLLRGEVEALARADAGGGTVLGRLMAGFGKKECCPVRDAHTPDTQSAPSLR